MCDGGGSYSTVQYLASAMSKHTLMHQTTPAHTTQGKASSQALEMFTSEVMNTYYVSGTSDWSKSPVDGPPG